MMLGNMPAWCCTKANSAYDTLFIGAANIGYFELKNFSISSLRFIVYMLLLLDVILISEGSDITHRHLQPLFHHPCVRWIIFALATLQGVEPRPAVLETVMLP